ncbi:MAG TPA: DUF998 domain-containing protein [Candidatus Saccharimonadales bacterium]|nr:DUF998 domain-containing protein [Candidatus Saccharimonadales bacterium]
MKQGMVKTFTDRFPFVGPIFWMVSFQYYLAQLIVAAAWTIPYSITINTISDLGNTVCGIYNGRYVCSPRHALMNVSFVTLGITMMIGAVLIYQEFRENLGGLIGFSFMGLAGLGTILVGLFPENVNATWHQLGAALPFFVGNLSMIILGLSLDIPRPLKIYTLFSGFISLTAAVLFTSHHFLSLGGGGMERIAAYPQTMWIIVFGLYISTNHLKAANQADLSANIKS